MKNVAGLTIKHDGYPEISEVRCKEMGSQVHYGVQRLPDETSFSTTDSVVEQRSPIDILPYHSKDSVNKEANN